MSSRPPSNLARVLVLGSITCGLAAWVVFAKNGVRDQLVPRNFGVVEEGHVYRAAALTPASLKRAHEQHQFKTIIDLGGFDVDPLADKLAQESAESLGITRYVFPLSGDGTGNPNAYVAALRVLADPANHPVLVHCSAGAQRTSGCIIMYRDFIQGGDDAAARTEAFQFRHDPKDNPRLFEYLDTWQGHIERAFRTGTQVPDHDEVPVVPFAPKRIDKP
jgi:protein tyrosine/serine phosphatase